MALRDYVLADASHTHPANTFNSGYYAQPGSVNEWTEQAAGAPTVSQSAVSQRVATTSAFSTSAYELPLVPKVRGYTIHGDCYCFVGSSSFVYDAERADASTQRTLA